MKADLSVISSKEVHCLQIRSVGSHSTSGREKEGKKERTGGEIQLKNEGNDGVALLIFIKDYGQNQGILLYQ